MRYSDCAKYPYPKSLLSAIKGEEYTEEITEDIVAGLEYSMSLLSEKRQAVLIEKFKNKRTDIELEDIMG